MPVDKLATMFTKVFGSRNERIVKSYRKRADEVTALESTVRPLADGELRAKTSEFKQRIADGEKVTTLLPEILATAREVMDRAVGIRNILNPEFRDQFKVDELPSDLRKTYDRLLEKAEELDPIAEPGHMLPVPGWMQVEIPVDLYEAVRAIYPRSRPPFRTRPFDVQLIGGTVLSEGRIAEMKTGEGKTIVAPLACYIACCEGLQCHVVTVNDYLVQRDRDWVFPFHHWLGFTVGAIHPVHMLEETARSLDPMLAEKKLGPSVNPATPSGAYQAAGMLKTEMYGCDIVYGTNSEFGFDYLRDNMKLTVEEQVQRKRDFCIIDEVDSILIDEARTPLIISGSAHEDAPRYGVADAVARHLMQKQRDWDAADKRFQQAQMRAKGLEGDIRNTSEKSQIASMREELKRLKEIEVPRLEADRDEHTQYYEVERERKAAHLTHDGVAEAQKVADIGSFYHGNNMDMPHLLENALRAHAVYQRDKEYVVEGDEVIIVDEFTGRKMIGRQWSDGLHQAVEAKERVKIKEETQTLATVTIQNFFKLYERLAGMTGTALTEATEFNEIYKLDVVSIPTNVPVVRGDHNDLIFLGEKDKWNAILDEIKRMHDVGRPVLVGTTSVETSEMVSEKLTKRHGIKHAVLNAKQHEREADIVTHAGELGAVMIATNMAGRGTDIKLATIDRAELVRHWQTRNMLPKQAKPTMDDDELVGLAYKHLAGREFGLNKTDLDDMSGEEARLRMMRHWCIHEAWIKPEKAQTWSAQQCEEALDKVPDFFLHRLQVWTHIEDMGGLHIVGTERHEARRIDNQLRGRAGRQGDNGSSRFFISLEDDLMKIFANKTVMNMLGRLGMKDGAPIEHGMVTKSIERAQRKVEERNYEIRKSLLEYDEAMEHQRKGFYSVRQEVLEGRSIDRIIFDYIEAAVGDAVDLYLAKDYVATQIAEWCRVSLDVSVDPAKLRADDLNGLQGTILSEARADAASNIEVSIGEYASDDIPPEEWDTRSLSQWAMSRYRVDLKQNQIRRMNVDEIRQKLTEAAHAQIDKTDLSEVAKFLDAQYAQTQLADWATNQFDIEFKADEMDGLSPDKAFDHILDRAREAYHQREIEYPVDFILDTAFKTVAAQPDAMGHVAEQLAGWSNRHYDLGWDAETVGTMDPAELREKLVEASKTWVEGDRLEKLVDEQLQQSDDVESLAQWATERFDAKLENGEFDDPATQRDVLLDAGRQFLRRELTQLERFVLLQILDQAWKDHLYAMDQLKDSVNLRSYAEKDPRIEYKREGGRLFTEMQRVVRDKVTGLIFRARLTADVEARNVYNETEAQHDEAGSLVKAAAKQGARGTAEQQADLDSAERAGGGVDVDRFASRKQRRAAAAAAGGGGKKRGGGKRRRR